jgi:hypothetical protein
LALISCSTNSKKEALRDVDYTSDRTGITLKLNASAKLNLEANLPHTLALGVIQLNSPTAALALSKNSSELDKLLSGIPSTDNAVLAVNRYIVQPSAMDTLTIKRVQNTQVIIIYTGYFSAGLDKRVRLYEVPVKITSNGWFDTTYVGKPMPLFLSLSLDEAAIDNLTVFNPNDDNSSSSPKVSNPVMNGGVPNPDAPVPKVMEL